MLSDYIIIIKLGFQPGKIYKCDSGKDVVHCGLVISMQHSWGGGQNIGVQINVYMMYYHYMRVWKKGFTHTDNTDF